MIVVADSSPLIALCRIGRLDLLNDLFGLLLIPDAVWNELTASPHFSYPFCCDWLRRAPASFRTGFPLDSMFSYSPAGNPVRALRGHVLAASRDEGV